MNKLKLALEDLSVESFGTTEMNGADSGTVRGFESDSTCEERICTCAEETEWDVTCGTCGIEHTCQNTCPTHFFCPTRYPYPGC